MRLVWVAPQLWRDDCFPQNDEFLPKLFFVYIYIYCTFRFLFLCPFAFSVFSHFPNIVISLSHSHYISFFLTMIFLFYSLSLYHSLSLSFFPFLSLSLSLSPPLSLCIYTRCIRFQTFFLWPLLLIVHTWNSSPLQSNLLRLQCTCSTVPTTSGRPHRSPLVWVCQWSSSQPLSSPQFSHNDSLWA